MTKNDPTWLSWRGMMHRCFREKDSAYYCYGAVGVTVCLTLRAAPSALIGLIGARPQGRTVDRIDNNGSYTCGYCQECVANGWSMNVRWATPLDQARNRSNSISVNIDGKIHFLSDIAKAAGVSYQSILRRHKKGVVGAALFGKAPPANVKHQIGNRSMTLREWSNETGIPYGTIQTRMYSGICGEALLAIPKRIGRHKTPCATVNLKESDLNL